MTASSLDPSIPGSGPAAGRLALGTLIAGCLAVCLAQIGIAIPATLNGLFQADLHPIGSQLTWISDAFLLPVAVLELTWPRSGTVTPSVTWSAAARRSAAACSR
jgi:hypothetical protein